MLSSNIPPLVISDVTGNHVVVSIVIDHVTVFEEKLYPYDGKIEMQDLTTIITPYVHDKRKVLLQIAVADDNGGHEDVAYCDVIYCAADVDCSAEEFLENNFLTLLDGMKLTAHDRGELLSMVGTDDVKAICYYDDDSREVFPLTAATESNGYRSFDVSPKRFEQGGKLLSGYVIVAGKRVMSYEVMDEALTDPAIVFENSFGVPETLYCVGTKTTESKFERSAVRVHGVKRNYNIEETRSFKCDTGFMRMSQQNWADDVMRSKDVALIKNVDGVWARGKAIVITDSNTACSNDDDAIFRVSFTYELAQRNHNVFSTTKSAGEIFDETFDSSFD